MDKKSDLIVKGGDEPSQQVVIYQSSDGKLCLEAHLQNETIWLSQSQIADLFGKDRSVISKHIKNIYDENELQPTETTMKSSNVQKMHITTFKPTTYYNLDMIISVGYRVNSAIATRFRQWATQTLKEYIVKGFVMDDERLKQIKHFGKDYFDEMLERIREIRLSERRFYQKITDIYALSADYDRNDEVTRDFFATVQNKMHWAIQGETAAEIVYNEADAKKIFMGLKTWKRAPAGKILKSDVIIAKNYLNEEYLKQLERIVSA